MVAGSRFVVLCLRVAGEPADRAVRHTWILVSPNNRTMGRGEAFYSDVEQCRAAVLFLKDRCPDLEGAVTQAERTSFRVGQWGWRVSIDDRVVAVSTRTYQRLRECEYSMTRFLDAVPGATLLAAVRQIRRG